jgi:hypothetical protein
MIEREKKDAGSPFHRAEKRALPAAEWVWRENRRFPKSNQELFAARFVLGEDPGDGTGLDEAVRTDCEELLAPGNPTHGVTQREIVARDSTFQTRLRGWLLRE